MFVFSSLNNSGLLPRKTFGKMQTKTAAANKGQHAALFGRNSAAYHHASDEPSSQLRCDASDPFLLQELPVRGGYSINQHLMVNWSIKC